MSGKDTADIEEARSLDHFRCKSFWLPSVVTFIRGAVERPRAQRGFNCPMEPKHPVEWVMEDLSCRLDSFTTVPSSK